MTQHVQIDDLRLRPDLIPEAADRIWRAWWQHRGVTPEFIQERLRKVVFSERGEFSFVAHHDGVFVGTTSFVLSDMDERPDLSPWIAAVWVDEAYRGQGFGSRLVTEVAQHAFSRGTPRLYLSARRERRPFYTSMGWSEIEENVGPNRLSVFSLDKAMAAT